MSTVFSKRVSDNRLNNYFLLPHELRNRILQVLSNFVSDYNHAFLNEMENLLVCEYGTLRQSGYEAARTSTYIAEEHAFTCTDAEFFDFIELSFRTKSYYGGNEGVEAINNVLRECGLTYELTPWTEQTTVLKKGLLRKTRQQSVRYPILVVKDTEFLYSEVVRPCLELLRDDRFHVAAGELQAALDAHRQGDWPATLTACCATLESILKTICAINGWKCQPDRDTCGVLLKICEDNGLYPNFYTQILLGVGTIRNKLGSAHGRGPEVDHQPSRVHAEHCIALTATHITFLLKLASET